MKLTMAVVNLMVWALGIVSEMFVGAWLWGWFMVPLGVVAIGPWHVLGLMMVGKVMGPSGFATIAYLKRVAKLDDTEETAMDLAINALWTSLIWTFLGIGAIAHSWTP